MKYLLTGASAFLLLTACSQKHKTDFDPTPPGVEFLKENPPTITIQKGDPATAGAALEGLSLAKSGSGRIKYSSKQVNADSAVFKDVEIKIPAQDEYSVGGADVDFDLDPKVNGPFLVAGETLKAETMEVQGLGVRDGKPGFARMVLSGVTFTSKSPPPDAKTKTDAEEGEITFESRATGKIRAMELVHPSPEVAAWVAGLFGKGAPTEMPEGAAFAFDRWAVDDVRLTSVEESDEQSVETVFLVGRAEVIGLKNEKADAFSLTGFSLQAAEGDAAPDVDIGVKRFAVRRTGMTSLGLQPSAGGATGSAMEVFSLANNDPIDPGFELLEIEGLNFNADGLKLDLPKLVSKVGRDKQGQAVKFVTDPYTLTIGTGEGAGGEELASQMAALGFEKIEISAAGDLVYDPKADLLTMVKGHNFFEVKDGFRLEVAAAYEGTAEMGGPNLESAGFGEMENKIAGMRLHGAEISLKDFGLVDRAINLQATREGTDPVEYRNAIKKNLNMMTGGALMMGADPLLFAEFSNAAGSFVKNPKTLTLRFRPKQPVELNALLDEEGLKGLSKKELGFSADNK